MMLNGGFVNANNITGRGTRSKRNAAKQLPMPSENSGAIDFIGFF
jgi:hypothetical protein